MICSHSRIKLDFAKDKKLEVAKLRNRLLAKLFMSVRTASVPKVYRAICYALLDVRRKGQ
jgi:hypothetical protein